MDEKDWKLILYKIEEQGFKGKGKFERFMEKVARDKVIFIEGSGEITISVK